MNWGYKLMFTFIAFAIMMGYLAFRAVGTTFELVGKEYYKDELRYQEVIDGAERANLLNTVVQLKQSGDTITLQMPAEMKGKDIAGSVLFYCAYDSKKDRKFPLEADSNGLQFFNTNQVDPGNYTVKANWSAGDKNFYTEKLITIR